ncbi:MAG: hypothetical protein AAF547_07975 [Actinomycetota bacterium]
MTTPVTPSPADTVAASPAPRTPGALLALYRLVLRHQLTRGRLALFAAVTALSVALGWIIGRASDNQVQDAVDTVSALGLGLIVPVVALVLGSAALGTWVEDETLVYVWLRPVRRVAVAVAATAAAATVVLPVTVGALSLLAALGTGGDADAIIGTAAGTALGGLAYTAVFVALGLVIRRALLWGLVYVFIWEFFVARAGDGAARLSINSYAASILADLSGIEIRLADRGTVTSYVVLGLVSAVAVGLTTWRLSRANVA